MKKDNVMIAVAPLIIILVGFLAANIGNIFIHAWTFIPLSLVYWGAILYIVKPTKSRLKLYFKKPIGNVCISILAFIPVLFCILSFMWGSKYVTNLLLITLWIIFAVINSFAEELYWRGYLLDNLSWKPSVKILYSTFLFALSHPLMWGVFSITIRSYIMVIPLLTMGLIWGYVYLKTRSLRWCTFAHFLVDMLNLSVWVFLNIYIPPIIKG